MAKETKNEVRNESTQAAENTGLTWPAKVQINLDSFIDDRTNEQREYVAIKLVKPFPDDPDVPDFKLTTKWESDSEIFKYRARKHLRVNPDLELSGVIQPVTYYNKKYKKDVTYIGLYVPDPFVTDRILELRVKGEGQQVLFSTLFRDMWNLHDVTVDPIKDDE